MAALPRPEHPVHIYIYWDNSNLYVESQNVAEEMEGDSPDVRMRVRIDFANLLLLAHGNRQVKRIVAAGSIPPELTKLWDKMKQNGVEVELCHRHGHGEQEMPDRTLQVEMLNDCIKYKASPGTMVLLTGDGAGYTRGKGLVTLENIHGMGWSVELLAWLNSCNRRLQRWVEQHGTFYPLDHFYWSITFLEASKTPWCSAPYRPSRSVDLRVKGTTQSPATKSPATTAASFPEEQEDWDAEIEAELRSQQ